MDPKEISSQGVPVAHLKIGECIATSREVIIQTVLGSCVSITFHDPVTRYSAMFHSMLPLSSMAREIRRPCNYVDTAIEGILERFAARRIPFRRLEAELYGGALTMQRTGVNELIQDSLDVGRKNAAVAREMLKEHGIAIRREDIHGNRGRKVFLYTATGETLMRYVSSDTFRQTLTLEQKRLLRSSVDKNALRAS